MRKVRRPTAKGIEEAGTYGMIALAAALAALVWLAPTAADAQQGGGDVIQITPDDPCFGVDGSTGRMKEGWNYTRIIDNCNARGDWLGFTLVGWDWVTGGNFSLMFVGVLILIVWAKYRVAIYPIYIGVVMLPISWFLFPDEFLSFALLLAGVAIGAYIWWIVTRQPN